MTHEEAFKPLDLAIWEMSEAFAGLADDAVWVRADPRLLSVGELAAHVANGEAKSFFAEFDSPLVCDEASYYPHSIAHPLSLTFGAGALYAEVKRIHEACKAKFLAELPALDSNCEFREGWTWIYTLQYMAFHIAYHTGQMYSVRHLLGHETANN